jgi:hypothetical protein
MTTKNELLKQIRRKCLDCCCGQRKEVRLCASANCPLWSLRFGRDPKPARSDGAKNFSSVQSVFLQEAAQRPIDE